MSKAEILEEIPKLTREEREEIRRKLDEIDGVAWLEHDDLTPEQWALVDQRMAEHEADPKSAIPWETLAPSLRKNLGCELSAGAASTGEPGYRGRCSLV
jgi:putative addiction module component (TIGR02574 family)